MRRMLRPQAAIGGAAELVAQVVHVAAEAGDVLAEVDLPAARRLEIVVGAVHRQRVAERGRDAVALLVAQRGAEEARRSSSRLIGLSTAGRAQAAGRRCAGCSAGRSGRCPTAGTAAGRQRRHTAFSKPASSKKSVCERNRSKPTARLRSWNFGSVKRNSMSCCRDVVWMRADRNWPRPRKLRCCALTREQEGVCRREARREGEFAGRFLLDLHLQDGAVVGRAGFVGDLDRVGVEEAERADAVLGDVEQRRVVRSRPRRCGFRDG